MPAISATTIAALRMKRGGKHDAACFVQSGALLASFRANARYNPFDGIVMGGVMRKQTQALTTEAGGLLERAGEMTLQRNGKNHFLAPACAFVSAAVGEPHTGHCRSLPQPLFIPGRAKNYLPKETRFRRQRCFRRPRFSQSAA
jgi:hypothetical protein